MSGLFLGGKSVRPEVEQIMRSVTVEAGKQVSYRDIENITDVSQSDGRFRSITASWRKRVLREYGIRIEAHDKTFHMLTADQAVDWGKKDVSKIGRATGRLVHKVDLIDTTALTSEEKKGQHNLLRRESAAMLEAMRKSAKAIAGPKPVSPANLRIAK